MKVDQQLLSLSMPGLLEEEFYLYKKIKTDDLLIPPKIKIQVGADGVKWESFEENIKQECLHISNRVRKGSYFFKPFREVEIPKNSADSAKHKKEVRTISISCIRDVLMQRIMYKAVNDQAEALFNEVSNVSFAYRRGKSAPDAAQLLYKYVKQGYTAVLDADIEKFFDCIPHEDLLVRVEKLLGKENNLLHTYFKRFISVDRVKWEHYKGDYKSFHNKKPIRTIRTQGIPQGGVLSGLLANLFLHSFDIWIMTELSRKFDLKYIRYADDFVILTRNIENVTKIQELTSRKLSEMKLTLHPSKEKTKRIDLKEKGEIVNFVGFSISPSGVRIKKANINNFKYRLNKIIHETNLFQSSKELNPIISKLTYKLLGNEAIELRTCQRCNLHEAKRSWFNYFSIITDVQQLRALDCWIRKKLYQKYYHNTGKRLKASELNAYQLVRLEDLYYKVKKVSSLECCRCSPFESQLKRHILINDLFKHSS
ncbi:reverse transcriptase domain-containing protein [Bacillus sp. Hm123]|uniref:reverse transcriptase domain-containing protein n=1 Tax=Bacillus sp. Hm123 TaxID=3450745 RepID=UPI003F4306B5